MDGAYLPNVNVIWQNEKSWLALEALIPTPWATRKLTAREATPTWAPLNRVKGVVRVVSLTTSDDIHITCLSNEAKYATPLLPEWFYLLIYNVMRSVLCNLGQITKAMVDNESIICENRKSPTKIGCWVQAPALLLQDRPIEQYPTWSH